MRTPPNPGRVVTGLLLVGLGLVAMLEAADVVSWGVVGTWWPVAIVALGGAQAWADRRVGWAAITLLAIGGVLLLGTTGVLGTRGASVLWPLALIGLGVALIAGWSLRRATLDGDDLSRVVVAAAPRFVVRSGAFRRADLTVVAGSVRLDLTKAELDPDGARVSITVLAGSAEVLVPEGWRVVVKGVAVLGGWDDTTSRRVDDGAPELVVRALAIVGGVDVRHPRRWV